jgi:outer membrane protein, heavy metal efflux system
MLLRPIRAIAIALSALASSATAAAPPLSLTLDQALVLAEQRSPIVQQARLERAVVASRRVGAEILLPANPWVSALVGGRSDDSGSLPAARGLELGVHLEQTVEVGGQRGARLDEVARAVEVAEARERLARIETRARARAAYLAARIAEAQADALRRRETLGQRLYESARARAQAGAASDVEVNLAAVEMGRLTGDRIEAELAVAEALGGLRRELAIEADAPIALATPLGRPALQSLQQQQMIDRALARRADLQAIDRARSQLDATIARLRREAIPSPTLFIDVASAQPGQTFVGGGIGLPLPLWRRNQGELAVVRAERARLDGERAIAERGVALEVVRALRLAAARDEGAVRWERDVVPAAEANVELLTQGWRAGKFDLFRVIQASREAGEARQRQLQLLGALWDAVIELDRATGTP